MEKLNLTKLHKTYFSAEPRPEIVDIKKSSFISIEGKGDPSGVGFGEDITALYSTAYAIKFACKTFQRDFTVSKLEGLWWFDEAKFASHSSTNTSIHVPRSEWHYRLLIMMPDYVTSSMVTAAIQSVVSKKSLVKAQKIQHYEMTEGKCVQMLHVGPFATEPQTLKCIQDFMDSEGFQKNGLHHEIYLSDFRKTAPEKLKTILREPAV